MWLRCAVRGCMGTGLIQRPTMVHVGYPQYRNVVVVSMVCGTPSQGDRPSPGHAPGICQHTCGVFAYWSAEALLPTTRSQLSALWSTLRHTIAFAVLTALGSSTIMAQYNTDWYILLCFVGYGCFWITFFFYQIASFKWPLKSCEIRWHWERQIIFLYQCFVTVVPLYEFGVGLFCESYHNEATIFRTILRLRVPCHLCESTLL